MPFVQNAEQQSPFCVHLFPSELQFGLIGVHLPLSQEPPQHWPFVVHAWLSLVHEGGWHAPFAQLPEQQSLPALHATPRFVQAPPSPQFVQQPPSPFGTTLSPFSVPSFPPSPLPLSPPQEGAPSTHATATKRIAKTQRLFMRRSGAS